jgi:two-component system sensor histidine kinase KdpD
MTIIDTLDRRRSALRQLRAYAEAALMVAASTLVGLAVAPRWGNSAVDLLYLPAVLGAALVGGLYPALLAAVASTLAYNFFFTAPHYTLRIHSPADLVTVIVLFIVALVTSQLIASVGKQARIAAAHAARNATIAGFARRLLSCTSEADIGAVAVRELGSLFACNAVMLAAQPPLELIAAEPGPVRLTPSDSAAAALTLETGEPAGRGAVRADPADWQFHAVRSQSAVLAVVGLARDDGVPPLRADQMALLGNLLDQIALATERTRLERDARAFEAVREHDRARSALVSTMGQDVRPRLATISGTVAQLRRDGTADKDLLSTLTAEAAKLDRYITDLVELSPATDRAPVVAGDVAIDIFHRSVTRGGKTVHLTPKEYAVLAELAKHPGRVLSHAHLLRTAWGPAHETQTDYLRVAIRGLRQKLEDDPAHPTVIINEPAVGYRLSARA